MPARDLDAWLSVYGPSVKRGRVTPEPDGAVAKLFRANADEDTTHAEGGAALVGNNVNDAQSADDDARQSLPIDGDPASSPEFVRNFAEAPATGCATLLDMARAASGWDPLKPEDPANVQRFYDYVNIVDSNAMFHLTMSGVTDYHRKSSNWSEVIKAISALFEGVSSEDQGKIQKSLEALAEAATSRTNTKQSKNLFAQNTIQTDRDEMTVYIYSSTIEFVEHDGKSTTRQQDFKIIRAQFKFLLDAWNEVTAERVAKYHFKSLNDWLDRFSSKQGDHPQVMTCFGEVAVKRASHA